MYEQFKNNIVQILANTQIRQQYKKHMSLLRIYEELTAAHTSKFIPYFADDIYKHCSSLKVGYIISRIFKICMCTTQIVSVFKQLNGFPNKLHVLPQTKFVLPMYKKSAVYISCANVYICFCMICDFNYAIMRFIRRSIDKL